MSAAPTYEDVVGKTGAVLEGTNAPLLNFARIPAIWAYLPVKPAERAVLTALVACSKYTNSGASFSVGRDLLATYAGVSPRTIDRTVALLERSGYLKVKGGQGKRRSYVLDFDGITARAWERYVEVNPNAVFIPGNKSKKK